MDKKCYSSDQVKNIRCLYIVLIIIWIILIYYFSIISLQGYFILFIPIIVFVVAIYNSSKITKEVENEMTKALIFPMMIVTGLAILNWIANDMTGHKDLIIRCIIISIVLIMLSSLDIWVELNWIYIYKHLRSALQTMSLVIMMTVLVSYAILKF